MSKRYWLFVVAVGLASSFSEMAWARPPYEATQTHKTTQEETAPEPTSSVTTPNIRSDYNLDNCYQSDDHDNADLCAQWRAALAAEEAADLAWWGNIIGGVGAVLSFAGMLLVLRALRHAKDANSISRIMGEAQTRPWVSVNLRIVLKAATNNENSDMWIEVEGDCYNCGQSPAMSLNFFADILPRKNDGPLPREMMETLCDTLKNDRKTGESLFPGAKATLKAAFILPGIEIEKVLRSQKTIGINFADIIQMLLIGSVNYQIAGSGEIHQTRFVFDVFDTSSGDYRVIWTGNPDWRLATWQVSNRGLIVAD